MRNLFISICFLVHASLHAQTADTVKLKEVSVSASRTSIFTTGNFVTEIDSSVLQNSSQQNLGDVLSSASSIFIKTYGSGGSATISSRGTEARHSAILWNGFNINSSSLGLTDLSIVPIAITGSVKLIHGGSSPVNGNSALGSVISLEQTQPPFGKHTKIYTFIEGGSFGNKHLTVGAEFGSSFIESKTVVFANGADNNFDYENIAKRNHPIETQQNGSFENYGLSQDFQFKINNNQQLSAGIWYQVNHREIPPMMTVPESSAEQRDSNLRVFLGYKISIKNSIIKIKAGFFREHQFYDDSQFEIYERYDVTSYLSEIEWRWMINEKFILSNGISSTSARAAFEEYAGNESRDIISAYSNAFYEPFTGWKLNAGVRKEFTNADNPPFSPSIGVEGNLYHNIILISANTGFHYNLPAMNDLYWIPGGNPDLKPEEAWSSEAGLILFKNQQNIPCIAFTFYRSVVDNWIKWQPGAGGVYTPDNLRQVTASGFEASVTYKKQIHSFNFSAVINYSFTKSELTESTTPFSEELVGKQLIYIPENIFNAVFQIQFKTISLQYNNTYTGVRYTSADNSSMLEGFNLADITINNFFNIKKHRLDIFAKIMNVYNSSYLVLAYRPTPGRWYSAGIKFNLNLTK